MNTQSSKQKRGFAWWLRATLLFVMILVVATWSAGAMSQTGNDFSAVDEYVKIEMKRLGIPGLA